MPNLTTGPGNPPVTVAADPAGSAWDFVSLRRRGLASLERLAGTTWTDHNAHDPGITILEQLCYVLTDLAYRANYDVRDLLAGAGSAGPFFRAAEILTTCPVTLVDLRKLVLDVEGVRNVWIEPASTLEPQLGFDPAENAFALDAPPPATPVTVRGVYRVLVAPDRGGVDPAAVAARLQANRPLGLDFLAPTVLQEQQIAVVAEIEIDDTVPPAEVLRAVYRAASDFISPRIRFYSEEEMLARGRAPDEIFDGPRLSHGFIDSDELSRAGRVTALHTSDLLAILMALHGVRAVHRLGWQKAPPFASPDQPTLDQVWKYAEPWVLALEPSQTPTLDLQATVITLVRGQVQWNPLHKDIAVLTADLLRADAPPVLTDAATDGPLALGTGRRLERYHSLQHHLPQVYGLDAAGLPAEATPERRAQVRQLRGYLTMFDQVLANGFSQMAHARDLFSVAPDSGTQPSYFAQLPVDVPALSELLASGFDAAALQTMLEIPGGDDASARQQKFLDHLLAWFAEDFGDFKLQSQALPRTPAARLETQRAFLRDYPAVSGGLGRAFDYTRPSWGEDNLGNLGGLEKRLAYKLGLTRFCRRALADLPPEDEGGFHLLEHVLLRPGPADLDPATPLFLAQPLNNDPYSAQLSLVFPDWITAFGGAGSDPGNSLRDYVGKTVREETPAHLSVRIHWLTRDQMTVFEPNYRAWLASMVAPRMSAPGTQLARGARDTLAGLLGLGVPYPLRDLTLDFAVDVAHGLPTDLLIRAAQPGVIYQLCSDEGDPLPGISAQLSADHGGEPTLAVTPVFIPGDLRDAAGFLRELSPGAVGVGAMLRRRLPPETLTLLDAAPGGSSPDAVCAAVLAVLGGIVRQGPLYDPHVFGDVCLSPWTRQLLARTPRSAAEETRLNRFLLEDAFPLGIWRTLTLSTPPINADVTFTVLASRAQADTLVETSLTASASIRAGISGTLPVQFSSGGQAATTPYGGLASIAVDGTQEGISYQLFSTVNPPMALSDPQPGNRGFTVTLTTNVPLTQNTAIKIKAFRASALATFRLLDTTLQLNVGPNPVRFPPGADLAAVVPYGGTPAAVAIDQSQASVSYQLFSIQNPPVVLSDPQPGNGATASLPINVPLKEDTGVQVKASLTATPETFTFLQNTVQVNVGPDPTVSLLATPPLVNYQGTSLFSLAPAQTTVRYTLWQRPIAPVDYFPPSPEGQSVTATVPSDPAADPPWFRFVGVPVASGVQMTVRVPDLGDGTQAPAGFTAAGPFAVSGGTPQLTTAPLTADTLFVVLATKPNGTALLLNQKIAVLVRPDPQRPLSTARSPVATGTAGVVLVGNPQEGVRYRLLNAADGTPVLNPGYAFDARELGTARVGADFAIDAPPDGSVPLPTGPLAAPAKFRVVAIKNATALTAPLNGTVSIDVTA